MNQTNKKRRICSIINNYEFKSSHLLNNNFRYLYIHKEINNNGSSIKPRLSLSTIKSLEFIVLSLLIICQYGRIKGRIK